MKRFKITYGNSSPQNFRSMQGGTTIYEHRFNVKQYFLLSTILMSENKFIMSSLKQMFPG